MKLEAITKFEHPSKLAVKTERAKDMDRPWLGWPLTMFTQLIHYYLQLVCYQSSNMTSIIIYCALISSYLATIAQKLTPRESRQTKEQRKTRSKDGQQIATTYLQKVTTSCYVQRPHPTCLCSITCRQRKPKTTDFWQQCVSTIPGAICLWTIITVDS